MRRKILTLAFALCLCLGITAAAEEVGEYFFKNNISNETRLIDMHILGAHDAFTAGLNANSPVDEAGAKLGDSGSSAAKSNWGEKYANGSRAQSAYVDELLNSGVRYFDVRLSRYQSGGEFFTTHGRISDQFTGEGGIARKISAWAAEHPGEIIVLDFQSLFDIQTENGGATQQSWKDLMAKLQSDGIAKYVYTKNGSLEKLTYGQLTDNGRRAAIVLFGQVTGSEADERFINRRDNDGYMRSFYPEKSSYDALYSALEAEVKGLKNDNREKYYYRFRVMQAQTTPSTLSFIFGSPNLINDANTNNIKILTDESYDEWSRVLPVLMVDNATSTAENFNALALEKLAKMNREFSQGVYRRTDGNFTLTGSNDNVPLNTEFTASLGGEQLTLSLGGADISGEMTLLIRSGGKKQRLLKDGAVLGETGADGWLRAKISSLGSFTLEETGETVDFAVTRPFLWYNFTDENGLNDISGSALNAAAEGAPEIGKGFAALSSGNVLRLPAGLTQHMQSSTASAWVCMTANTNNSRLFDIGRYQRASIFAHAASNKTSAGLKNQDTVSADGSGLSVGKWTHIAAVCADGKLSLYVDGALVQTKPYTNPSPETINDWFNSNGSFIGRTQWFTFNENANDNPDINAKVADFRLYDTALSADEIKRLARAPKLRFVDINTGEEISPAQDIDVPTAYSGCTAPEALGEYTLVRLAAVTDMAAESDAVAYYSAPEVLSLKTENGTAKAEVSLSSPREGAVLILAAYSGGGLREVKTQPVTGLGAALELTPNEGETVKAFLWYGGELRPIVPEKQLGGTI